MATEHKWVGVNYIPDTPGADVPPEYFMARIYDQDAMLVIDAASSLGLRIAIVTDSMKTDARRNTGR